MSQIYFGLVKLEITFMLKNKLYRLDMLQNQHFNSSLTFVKLKVEVG